MDIKHYRNLSQIHDKLLYLEDTATALASTDTSEKCRSSAFKMIASYIKGIREELSEMIGDKAYS